MISKVASLAARSVRYLESGAGQPLVLLHAFPLHADQWLPQLARPAAGWRVIAPDLRGFGPRAAPGGVEDGTVDVHATDTFELMTHLGIDQATICGLSLGGYVALAMVARAPERVRGLVLADTRATADTAEGQAGRERMLALVAREGPGGIATEMLPKLLSESTRRDQPDLADALRRIIETNSTEGLASAIRALRDRPDRTRLLSSISCPTMIVCGEEDTLTPLSDSELMHTAISGSELLIIPRAGHLSNVENPEAFSTALWSVRSLSGPGRA